MHLPENKIEQFVFAPDGLDDVEKHSIEAHLKNCTTCKEILNSTIEVYSLIEKGLEDSTISFDALIADKVFNKIKKENIRALLSNQNAVEIYEGRINIVEKGPHYYLSNIFKMVFQHPVTTSGIVIFGILVIGFLINYSVTKLKNNNPIYADIRDGILKVYNTEGDILWKKMVGNIPDTEIDHVSTTSFEKRYIDIIDIDNDGRNELLLSGNNYNNLFANDSLYCFDKEGNLRWKTSAGETLNLGTAKWQHTKWYITDFFTIASANKKSLIVIAHDDIYAPLIISKINTADGKVVSSYYHCGWNQPRAEILDVNNDGNEEIVLGLTNNALRRAAILVLSPDNLIGMAPANKEFYSPDYVKGEELFYILFPITNLSEKYARSYYYRITELNIGIDKITAFAIEAPGSKEIRDTKIIYSLDKSMKVLTAIGSQEFNSHYDTLNKKGLLDKPRNLDYFRDLVQAVQYWDGDKFVNYYIMNKYFSNNKTAKK